MWYQERDEGVLLFVKVVPKSKKNAVVGYYGDFLKIKITAPPEKGKANAELTGFLARFFGVPKNSVSIVRGQTQAVKMVFVPIPVDKLLTDVIMKK